MNKKNKVSHKTRREEEKRQRVIPSPKPQSPTVENAAVEEKKPTLSAGKKYSKAKAAGLKSTFTLTSDTLLMTSFGRGNKALREYHVVGDCIEGLTPEHVFTAGDNSLPKRIEIRGRIVQEASADNPLYTSESQLDAAPAVEQKEKGSDLIHIRKPLEKMIFGQNFEDNIHIQLAYSILDIDKILAVHVNNVVYALNNMLRSEGSVHWDDLISNLGLSKTYDKFIKTADSMPGEEPTPGQHYKELFLELMAKPQLEYFGTILKDTEAIKTACKANKNNKNATDEKAIRQEMEEEQRRRAYYRLCLLGMMRQNTAHKAGTDMFTLDEKFDKQNNEDAPRQSARNDLNNLFSQRVKDLNQNFLKLAKVNLVILFEAFGAKTREEKKLIVQEYYDFVVRKSYKNQGFSVKQLREIMFARFAPQTVEQKYDSVRSKLNAFTDFAVFKHYLNNQDETTAMVENLRASMSDEEKDQCYQEEAKRLWPMVKNIILDHILPKMNGESIKEISTHPDKDVDQSMLAEVEIGDQAHMFSKLMYLLTHFLDGKEINDLLTTLIHHFENIAGFLDVMAQEEILCPFAEKYSMFADSQAIAEELRTINSFARMARETPLAKQVMYEEAALILGYRGSDDERKAYVAQMLNKQDVWYKAHAGFRNFIANNVIESDRFKYLVRYGNVAKLRALAGNTKVLMLVLKDIPDAQILRYYNSCNLTDKLYDDSMRQSLADSLYSVNITDFENVKQRERVNEEKERLKALIRLYLTVLYLLIKNLVYVNSRYFLAFHCVERDAHITDKEKYYADGRFNTRCYSAFASDFIKKYRKEGRVTGYLQKNFANSDDWVISQFRNSVEHLNTVRGADSYIQEVKSVSSYFGLYHYLMQRTLQEQYNFFCGKKSGDGSVIIDANSINQAMLGYFKLVNQYHTYCKDMVKALNVAFAYNLPRYKNLSIEELFDKNRPGKKTAKNAMEPEGEAS